MLLTVLSLLVLFQFKHLFCDYFLQGKYMLGKFNEKNWCCPLLAHVGVHAIGTMIIVAIFAKLFPITWTVAISAVLIDVVFHFTMDRIKVVYSKKYSTQDKQFWWWLGVDQTVHHLTHYFIIFLLVASVLV